MMVVDGRNSKRSIGVTTQVLGQLMKHYGAYEALNWDGGGSSNLYVRHLGQVNNGSDGSERPVTNAMFAVANLPEADEVIAELIPYHTS
jgi:exopolysaccharide biosynthesis protein